MGLRGALRLTVLALLWGSSFLFIKVALQGLSPVQVVLGRLCVGAGVVLLVLLAGGGRLPRTRTTWTHCLAATLIGTVLPYFLFAWAQQRLSSNVAGVLNATTPLWTLVATGAVGRRGIASARITGLLLGFAGTVVVLAPWQAVPIPGSLAAQFACLLAAASYGVAYVYIDRFLRGREPPLVLAATQLVLAAVVLALITPFTALDPIALSREVVGSILALGALGTGAAYVLNYRLIVEEGATTASLTTYLLPIVSVVLGGLVLAEPVGWNLVAGAAIVLLGVALCERHITGRRWATIPMYVRPRRGPRRAPPARHRARPW